MSFFKCFVLALFASLSICSAFAKVKIFQATMSGGGCPGDTATALIASNEKSLSVNFSDYYVTSGEINSTLAGKKCSILVQLEVMSGVSMRITSAEYRGQVELSLTGLYRVIADYSFAGAMGPVLVHDIFPVSRITDQRTEDFVVKSVPKPYETAWTECFRSDHALIANVDLISRSTGWGTNLITLGGRPRSGTPVPGIIYTIETKSCY